MRSLFLTFLLIFPLTVRAEGVKIVVTVYPLRLIMQEIVVEDDTVSALIEGNVDPHHYTLKPTDIGLLESADYVVSVGGGYEPWFSPPKKPTHSKYPTHREVGSSIVPSKGDLHFWTSPLLAAKAATILADDLCIARPRHCDRYRQQSRDFERRSMSLTEALIEEMRAVNHRAFFSLHPAWGHLSRITGLTQIDFGRDCEECEPTPKELKRAMEKIKELGVTVLVTEPTISQSRVSFFSEELELVPLVLDSSGRGQTSYHGFIRGVVGPLAEALSRE